MTGAEKLINAMKKINSSGQPIQSQITSATVEKLNPLTFKIENRLKLRVKVLLKMNLLQLEVLILRKLIFRKWKVKLSPIYILQVKC